MASRFWVGGTGNWDASTTTNWAATSGGAGGQSVPTSVDNVTFDTLSNTIAYTVTITASAVCANLVVGGPLVGNLTLAGSQALAVWGNLTLPASGLTRTYTGVITLSATSGTQVITTNGVTLASSIACGGNGGTVQLGSNLTTGSGNTLSMVAGSTLNCVNGGNNYTFLAGTFSAIGACTLTLGSGTHTINGTSTCWTFSTTGTLTATTGTIKFTNVSASSVTFTGGGHTYGNIWFARGSASGSSAIIGGSNTFTDIKDDGTASHSLLFGANVTQNCMTFTVTGDVSHTITLTTQGGGTQNYFLTKNGSGKISSDYLNIQHCVANPGYTWYAGVNSTNNQGVTTAGSGWIFTVPPTTNIKTVEGVAIASVSNQDALPAYQIASRNGVF